MPSSYVLTLGCPDRPGIVYRVSEFLFAQGANIVDSAQFDDKHSDRFFMRVQFECAAERALASIESDFAPLAAEFSMDCRFVDTTVRTRTMILVSQHGHCLNDLLFRWQTGALPIDIAAIVSNHRDFYRLAASHDIPFHHIPVTRDTKAVAERKLVDLLDECRIDLVVLARYMQILSPELCGRLHGRAINIHHSFLPSFKGARPYYQAFERGVKLIGATAHYVTTDLDEGPIIEQDITRVDHRMDPDALTLAGRDVESMVLARAVTWHAQHRVILNGAKTVVFR
jgi:formyltetrahydrofolate deformylase